MGTKVVLTGVPIEDAAVGYAVYDSSGSGSLGSGSEAGSVSSQRWETSVDGDHWTPVAGATAPTFTPGDAQVGRFLRVVVQVDGNSRESDEVRVANVNDAPRGTLAVSGTARQGETIAVADAVADADGIPAGGRVYHWQAQGANGVWTDIAGANGAAFTLTEAEAGRAVRAVLAYTDRHGTAETVAGAPTVAVENTNDAPGGVLGVTGDAEQGGTLTLTDGVTDADGFQPGHRSYSWEVQGEDGSWTRIAGAYGLTFSPTQAEVGRSVRAVFSYIDGHGRHERVESAPTAAIRNVNDTPGGGLGISGDSRQGATLTLTDAVTDADGMAGAVREYQWQLADGNGGWTGIEGATGVAFTLTQAEVGCSVRAVMAYRDDRGQWETPVTAGTAPVENVNDLPFGSLTVGGTPAKGRTLSLVDLVNDHDGIPEGGRSYKWQARDANGAWADIQGATDETFTLTQTEVGHAVRGVVVYTDEGGAAESFASAPTATVAASNAAPTGTPMLATAGGGGPREDAVITVDVSGIADADGLGAFAYAWSRESAQGAWMPIEGFDGASYAPGDADVGARLRVEVSYTDGGGAPETFAATTSAIANANDAPTGAVTLSGRAVRGATVTASTAPLADADGMGAVSLRWERLNEDLWTPIAGATAAAYTLSEADVGHRLRAVATWTDGHGTAEQTAAETGVVATVRAIPPPPPELGEIERDAAADEWTSADLARMIAEGGTFAPPAGVDSIELADGVLSFGTGTKEAFLARLYLGLLGREGDVEGLAFAQEALADGASRADLARMFLSSGEFEARRHGARTDAEFVADLYDAFLGRGGDAEGRAFWAAALGAGAAQAEIVAAIADSVEAEGHMQASTAWVFVADAEAVLVRSHYRCALGREADASGLLFWSDLLERGVDLRTIGGAFGETAEFQARHRASTDKAFVERLYQDGLGREAEAAGLDHWLGFLASGQMGRGEIAFHFSMTPEARGGLDWVL